MENIIFKKAKALNADQPVSKLPSILTENIKGKANGEWNENFKSKSGIFSILKHEKAVSLKVANCKIAEAFAAVSEAHSFCYYLLQQVL